ncbi:peptidylprolyl isomerase [Candidatus Cloacimonadota bacterium]
MKRALLLLMLTMLLFSCKQSNEENYVVAQVNQEQLLIEDLKANFNEKQWEDLSKKDKEELIQDWIQLALLSQEADNLGISTTPQIKNKISLAEKNIKSNALIAQKLAEIKVSEDDLFNYYRVHKSQYQKSHKEYKVQRIFVTDETMLDEVKTAIQETSFKEAAIKYSEESIGNSGGYMGFVAEQNISSELWNALTKLKLYRWQTVQSDGGFYIIRFYDEKTVSTDKTFVEVIESIRSILLKQKQQEAYEDLIEELKKKSEIAISL